MGSNVHNQIEDTWIPVSAELNGQPFPAEILRTMQLSIDKRDYIVNVGGVLDWGIIIVDPEKVPMTMYIIGTEGPNKRKTFLAIYKIADGHLVICYDLDGRNRPTEFRSKPHSQIFLVEYRRVRV